MILWKTYCCIGACAWCLHVLLPNIIYVCFILGFPHLIYFYVAFVLYIISHRFSFDLYTVYVYAHMLATCFVIYIGFVLLHLLSLMFYSAFVHVYEWLCTVWTWSCICFVNDVFPFLFSKVFHSNLWCVFIHVFTHVCCLHAFKCEFAQDVLLHVHKYISSVYSCASCKCFNIFCTYFCSILQKII